MVGHNSIGANVTSAQYEKDLIKLREIIDRLYNNSQQKASIAAPSAFFYAPWYKDFVNGTGPGIVDILTHHIYNMGAGSSTTIFIPLDTSRVETIIKYLNNEIVIKLHLWFF